MPRANLEIVRASFEAFSRGDFEAAFGAHAADTEWCTAADEPDRQTYQGIEGLHDLVASLADAWADRFGDHMEFGELVERGDWVIVPWSARLRGKGSGVAVDVSETYAVRLRAGRIVRVDEYRTLEQALDAVRPA